MPTYTVHLIQTVSTAVIVEADSIDEAKELAFQSSDMPGSMSSSALRATACFCASIARCR